MATGNGAEVALSFGADMYKKLFPAEYVRKCLASKVRPDSRTIEAARAVQLQTDVVQTAASSSLVKLGKTSVLTAIKLAVGTPAVATPTRARSVRWVDCGRLVWCCSGLTLSVVVNSRPGALVAAVLEPILGRPAVGGVAEHQQSAHEDHRRVRISGMAVASG